MKNDGNYAKNALVDWEKGHDGVLRVTLEWVCTGRELYKVAYDVRESSMIVERWDCIKGQLWAPTWPLWWWAGEQMRYDRNLHGSWFWQMTSYSGRRWRRIKRGGGLTLKGVKWRFAVAKRTAWMLMWGIEVAWWSLRELSFWKRRISSSEAQ